MQDGYLICYKKTRIYDKIVSGSSEIFRFVVKYSFRYILNYLNGLPVSCILWKFLYFCASIISYF